jgi:hypothetical protein
VLLHVLLLCVSMYKERGILRAASWAGLKKLEQQAQLLLLSLNERVFMLLCLLLEHQALLLLNSKQTGGRAAELKEVEICI